MSIVISDLASKLATALLPYLPYLIKGGKLIGAEAFKAIGKKFGETSSKGVKTLWEKIKGNIQKDPEAIKTIGKVSEKIEEPKSLSVLVWQLEEVLNKMQDGEILSIQKLLESELAKNIIVAIGEGSVAIGGNANDAIIITGDDNKVNK